MPRDFSQLVMTNLRRIAHTPREAECIMGLLYMQVVLVCLAHAAQEARAATREAEQAAEGSRSEEMLTPSSPDPEPGRCHPPARSRQPSRGMVGAFLRPGNHHPGRALSCVGFM